MKYIYALFNWLFGMAMLFVAVATIQESFRGALCFLALGLIFLPPVRKAAFDRTKIHLDSGWRGLLVLILLIAGGLFTGVDSAEKQTQGAIARFNENRDSILSGAKTALDKKDYASVVAQTREYLPTKDLELSSMYNKAQAELNKIQRAREKAEEKAQAESKTKAILAELETVQPGNLLKLAGLYKQLAELNPESSEYQEKHNQYQKNYDDLQEIIRQNTEKKRIELERLTKRFGSKPEKLNSFSGGRTYYYEVQQYLKKVANDPDSIEIDKCTDAINTDNGWLVGCDYRGRNAFGGMIRQSNWFVIVHGRVVAMHDSRAYKR